MRSILGLLALVGCGKGSTTCPSVDELMRPGAVRKEIEIVVGVCRADKWSDSVTKCLRNAPTDAAMEKCFKLLSAGQQQHLTAAFEPQQEAMDRQAQVEAREYDLSFKRELDAMKLEQLSARAPQCADYRAAIDAGRKATLACSSPGGQLEMYGFQQQVKQQLKQLMTITDDQALGAACAREAGELRTSSTYNCR